MNQIYPTPLLTSWPTLISLRQIISWIKGEDKSNPFGKLRASRKGKKSKSVEFFKTGVVISNFGY